MINANMNDAVPLDAPAMLYNDRTLVPLRAVSEAFDCEVQWDGETKTVNIYNKDFVDFSNETEQTTVYASTTDELLNSIGSNKRIVLTSEYYNLSDAKEPDNPHLERQINRDSSFLGSYIIKDVINMTIEGNAEIAADDIYAAVLSFENCGKITLDGITAGHTEYFEEYQCEGSVLKFSYCQQITIKNCNLYGCGAIGINAVSTSDLYADKTNICDCSYCAVYLFYSQNIRLNECNIYDNSRTVKKIIAFHNGKR